MRSLSLITASTLLLASGVVAAGPALAGSVGNGDITVNAPDYAPRAGCATYPIKWNVNLNASGGQSLLLFLTVTKSKKTVAQTHVQTSISESGVFSPRLCNANGVYTITAQYEEQTQSGQTGAALTTQLNIMNPGLKPVVHPYFTGTPHAGHVLVAHPGKWNPSATSYRYQWIHDGRSVRGATHNTLTLTSQWSGHTVALKVIAATPGHSEGVYITKSVKVS